MDNENKNPDALNKDEELTAVLKRLSELLDSSVSLEEAIALAKKQNDGENTVDPQEDKADDTVISDVEAAEPRAEVAAEEDVSEKVDADTAEVEEAEVTEKVDAEEPNNGEKTEDAVFQSPIEQIISRISKAEKENAERIAKGEVAACQTASEETAEKKEESGEQPVTEKKRSPFGVLELIETLKDSDESGEPAAEVMAEETAQASEDNNEASADEAEVAVEEVDGQSDEACAEETGETVKASSKIFSDLLACFDGKKIPDELLASDDITVEREEEAVEVFEESENVVTDTETDNAEEAEEEESEEEEADEEQTEFVPLEHEAPDEKDELFSEIFSEERSERRNKEKDRKMWQKSAGDSNSVVLGIFDWLEVIVLSAAFALILFTFVMRLAVVDGNSMNHTLHDKEVLIISDLMYTPDNGDIVVFSSPNYPEPIVKRVIAVPGQTVDIDFETWTVTVDGKKVEEGYVNRVPGVMNRSDMEFPLTVPEGKVFVMGDNRNDSLDSRNSRIGFVDERYILGEVKIRLFPFNRFGKVD